MEQPLISVIIPAYNIKEFFPLCMETVLRQSYRNLEIIIVDDGSTDGTSDLCDEYAQKDSRVRVIHKKNGGLGFARNSGLEIACGEFVSFLDSDDYVDLGTYKFLYDKATFNTLEVVYYKYTQFDGDNIPSVDYSDADELYRGKDVQILMLNMIASRPNEKLDRRIECSACTALYKRSIIGDNHISFHSEHELISEDMIFNLDFLSYAGSAVYNQSTLYFYRVNPGSTTHIIRYDRYEKYKQLYNYINANYLYHVPELRLRTNRFLIGHVRRHLLNTLASDIKYTEKIQIFNKVSSDTIWKFFAIKYPWKDLPILYRVCFLLVLKKWFTLMYLIAELKHLCKLSSPLLRLIRR